jgi:hypothetical protein
MKRILLIGTFALGGVFLGTSRAPAQIYIRAPFVRVQIGPGVSVQAPGVNLFIPPAPVVVASPPVTFTPAAPGAKPAPPLELLPPPTKLAPAAPAAPAPVQAPQLPTLAQFASTFNPKAGSYEVDLINPVTQEPAKVRFTLPEGLPTKVNVRANDIEFRYGALQFVRIEFDKDGAQVITRTAR